MSHAMFLCKTAQIKSRKNICTNGLLRELFKQWDMLIGSCMKNDLREVLHEKLRHVLSICDITNIWIEASGVWMRMQALSQIKKSGFVDIEGDQGLGFIV